MLIYYVTLSFWPKDDCIYLMDIASVKDLTTLVVRGQRLSTL